MTDDLASRYAAVRSQVPPSITVIAVSKLQPIEKIEALFKLGHRDFGENYAQELVQKAVELRARGCDGIRWHMIGPLQRNKVKMVLPEIFALHTLDGVKLADEIEKRWEASQRTDALCVFVQVNVDAEASKSGMAPAEVPALCAEVAKRPHLRMEGLMCIPDPDRSDVLAPFQALRELEKRCQPHTRGQLSMGMSADWEVALQAGATHVRIGTSIFGERQALDKN